VWTQVWTGRRAMKETLIKRELLACPGGLKGRPYKQRMDGFAITSID